MSLLFLTFLAASAAAAATGTICPIDLGGGNIGMVQLPA